MSTLAISCVTDLVLGNIITDGPGDFRRCIAIHCGPKLDIIKLQSDQPHRLSFPIDPELTENNQLMEKLKGAQGAQREAVARESSERARRLDMQEEYEDFASVIPVLVGVINRLTHQVDAALGESRAMAGDNAEYRSVNERLSRMNHKQRKTLEAIENLTDTAIEAVSQVRNAVPVD